MDKVRLINDLTLDLNDHVMVKKAILLALIEKVPAEFFEELRREMVKKTHASSNYEFQAWAIKSRKALDLTQEQVSKATGIGQEELSKFETGIINFGKMRTEKLRAYYENQIHGLKE